MGRKIIAEFLGTFALVFLAVGAAVTGIATEAGGAPSGVLGVAVAFGFVLIVIAYAFGPISGAHVNPAVTLAMVIAKRQSPGELVPYWIAQFAGAIVGAFLLWLMVEQFDVVDTTGGLGTNGYGDRGGIDLTGAFVVETVLTALFILAILLVTDSAAAAGFAGLAIGAALLCVHLVGIPLTGTSVNPARSVGPALFEGGDSLSQVWLFIVAPLLGGAIAAVVYGFTRTLEAREAIEPHAAVNPTP